MLNRADYNPTQFNHVGKQRGALPLVVVKNILICGNFMGKQVTRQWETLKTMSGQLEVLRDGDKSRKTHKCRHNNKNSGCK